MERNEIESRNNIGRRESNRQMATYQNESSAAATAWKIVGGTALALVLVTVIFALPDIKRYIKISTM